MIFNNSKKDSVYKVYVSDELVDNDWDNFVFHCNGGHYAQTALWAQSRTIRDWRCLRIIIKEKDKIIAGAQILFRKISLIGSVGYLFRGPVCDEANIDLNELLIREIKRVCKDNHIIYLVVKPACNGEELAKLLPDAGFHNMTELYGDIASIAIDLTQDIDTIIAHMARTKRQKIRHTDFGKEVTIRLGTHDDIHGFYRVYTCSSQRIGYSPAPENYFNRLWDIFEPHGYLKLFIFEYDGEPVSALVTIPFKDTVNAYKIGWSGDHKNLYPNDLVWWEAIQWAKSSGYHYFDFGGVCLETAQALLQKNQNKENKIDTSSKFKLDFGGQLICYPETFDIINLPVLDWIYRALFPYVKNLPIMQKLINLGH
jgi:lipid II:glycine glycyltransferase (peptidoglycan interpeptide bridge formation enzyme)